MNFTHVTPPFRQIAPLAGKRVEICGTSRHDMNGQRGVATDFHTIGGWLQLGRGIVKDETKLRYEVQLDSGQKFKVRPANLRAESKKGRGKGGK